MAKNGKKGFFGEFKEFIARGNVVDMAVGVIIGGAFKAIADSLVNDVIMPLVSMLTGGVDFSAWKWVLKAAEGEAPEVAVNFGALLSAIVSFIIVAFAIFCMVKALNRLHRKKEEAPAEPAPEPEPSREEVLLTEIRDLLKK